MPAAALQPFGKALFGVAHANAYASIYDAVNGVTTGSSNNNAFAMQFGGGLDFALTPHFQIRPAEVDYLYTRLASTAPTIPALRTTSGTWLAPTLPSEAEASNPPKRNILMGW